MNQITESKMWSKSFDFQLHQNSRSRDKKFDQKAKVQLIFIIVFPWCNVIFEKNLPAPYEVISELVEVKSKFHLVFKSSNYKPPFVFGFDEFGPRSNFDLGNLRRGIFSKITSLKPGQTNKNISYVSALRSTFSLNLLV